MNVVDLNPKERNYVVLFLIIPGLNNVSQGCSMLIGRMIQEALDTALTARGLLAAAAPAVPYIFSAMRREHPIPSDPGESTTPQPPPRIHPSPGLDAGRRFVEDVTQRLYGGSPLAFVTHEDRLYFGIQVADLESGQETVEAEVKRLGFLELAEIGYYDSVNNLIGAWNPAKAAMSITPHCVEVLQSAGLLPEHSSTTQFESPAPVPAILCAG